MFTIEGKIMIKMIATDIDGTILDWNLGDFTPKLKECIKSLTEAGIKVVLVTGRMHESAMVMAKELGLSTPIVSYQGGMIKEQNGKCLYRKDLDPQKAKEIIKWAKDNNIHINLYIDDTLYVEEDNETIKNYAGVRYVNYKVCPFDKLDIKNVNKVLAIKYNDAESVSKWVKILSEKYPELYIVKSTPFFCEVSNIDAKKSNAVEFLRNYWGIKKEEVLTIGDQNNDIELLKSGGIKVAMGNGTPELKECADFITDSVENDGFVKAVEKFISFPVR